MSEKEKKSREMLEQLEKLPPKAQERIGYMIEGALVLAESRDDRPAQPGQERMKKAPERGRRGKNDRSIDRNELAFCAGKCLVYQDVHWQSTVVRVGRSSSERGKHCGADWSITLALTIPE